MAQAPLQVILPMPIAVQRVMAVVLPQLELQEK